MGSAALDLDAILRIPPTSPSRRDYGIRTPPRSPSPVNLDRSSRPQSPWLPHGEALSPASRQAETFRLYESNPPPLCLDRTTNYYSGPLPAAPPQGNEHRSLPSYSGPLPGFSTTTTESFEFSTWARIYHRQHANDEGSGVTASLGSLCDGCVAGAREGEEVAKRDASATSTFFLASPATQFGARAGMHGRVGSVSGELGRSTDDVAKQKSLTARGYKSGELGPATEGVGEGNAVETVRKERWESLSSNCDEPMVTIPFKWEEAASVKSTSAESRSRASSVSAPKSHSRASSTSTSASAPKSHSQASSTSAPKSTKGSQIGAGIGDFSFGSSHTKADSVHGSEASHSSVTSCAASKPVKTTPPTPPAKSKPVVRSAVPFKWEDAPGKPKHEDTTRTKTETATSPSLQLPPRLASATARRGSWSTSTPPSITSARRSLSVSRPRPLSHSSPDSSSSKQEKSSRQPSPQPSVQLSPSPQPSVHLSPSPQPSVQPTPSPQPSVQLSPSPSPQPSTQPRHTLGPNFLSGPLDNTAKPKPEPSPASKSGPISPEGFSQFQNTDFFSVRSPTSTLQGPGSSSSDGHSHSDNCSRKSPSVTYSHSRSGTSAESLEHWSEHEFEPETAGNLPSMPSLLSSMPLPPPSPSPSTCSSSKPASIPISAISSNSEFTPSKYTVDPPTRLPYKMPSPSGHADAVVAVTRLSPSPLRLRSNSKCFELPRFLSKGSGHASEEHSSSSWDAPSGGLDDGYRSPAYKATLDLLSPSPSVTTMTTPASAKSRSRGGKLGSASPRHFVEGLRSSLKLSFHIFSKRKSGKSSPVIVHEDPFTKRHPALVL